MLLTLILVILLPLFVAGAPTKNEPVVTLRQGRFTGAHLEQPGLNRRVKGFMGIPYAQPPVGDLRLRPLVPVNASSDSFDATRFGTVCPQASLVNGNTPDAEGMSEDCLTINVFVPENDPYGKPVPKNMPVGVNIHGGAFNLGAARALNVSSMVSWSDKPFIGVSFNYRIGAMGFLPSSLAAKEGILNLGLRDQKLALEWVRDNIASFGGDPKQVTIFGPSAGAHSVGHHLLNLEEGGEKLFHRVIMENGAPTARRVPTADDPLVEKQFNEFLNLTGCTNSNTDAILPCLRAVSEDDFIQASLTLFSNYTGSLRWPFQPVIDGELVEEKPSKQWADGDFNKVPILTGFATDEGTQFVNPYIDSSDAFNELFTTLIPAFNATDLQALNEIYPDPATNPNSPYLETRGLGLGSQYKRAATAYGHYAYVCNVFTTADYASDEVPVWVWHWATNVSRVLGAAHTSHTPYESYEQDIRSISDTQQQLAADVTGYLTSFITTGDPNTVRTNVGKDRPEWKKYNSAKEGAVLVLGDGNDERAGGSNKGVVAAMGVNNRFTKECQFWNSMTEKLSR